MKINIAIPSRARAQSLITPRKFGLDTDDYTVFVRTDDEAKEYKAAGYKEVITTNVAKGVTPARNFILDYYPKDANIIMLDDDIVGIYKKFESSLIPVSGVKLMKLINDTFELCKKRGIYLWGLYPVPNAFYMKDSINPRAFVIGTFMGIRNTDLRFDEQITLKEDYDFTIQHIAKYGNVCRYNNYTIKAKHYTNKGGCEIFRSDELEQQSKRLLQRKWPRWVKDNPRSPNEVLLRFK